MACRSFEHHVIVGILPSPTAMAAPPKPQLEIRIPAAATPPPPKVVISPGKPETDPGGIGLPKHRLDIISQPGADPFIGIQGEKRPETLTAETQ